MAEPAISQRLRAVLVEIASIGADDVVSRGVLATPAGEVAICVEDAQTLLDAMEVYAVLAAMVDRGLQPRAIRALLSLMDRGIDPTTFAALSRAGGVETLQIIKDRHEATDQA